VAILFILLKTMLLALVTNDESIRVSVVRGIVWVLVVTHTSSDELLQYANECDGQHGPSLRRHTHIPPTVRSLTCFMHTHTQKMVLFIHSSCLKWAVLGQYKLHFGLDFKPQVQRLCENVMVSLVDAFSLSFTSSVKYTQTSFPHSYSLILSCKHLDARDRGSYAPVPGVAALQLITVTLGESIPHSQLATGPAQAGFHLSWVV